ncbi:hypothetical protein [Pseudomonas jessenii]|uniref:hypothetical protein n=1 Tax=Pseudomonas jessenii TaxID=77298 RepID=UPI003891B673
MLTTKKALIILSVVIVVSLAIGLTLTSGSSVQQLTQLKPCYYGSGQCYLPLPSINSLMP